LKHDMSLQMPWSEHLLAAKRAEASAAKPTILGMPEGPILRRHCWHPASLHVKFRNPEEAQGAQRPVGWPTTKERADVATISSREPTQQHADDRPRFARLADDDFIGDRWH
jgi:hypothetical protein